MPDCLCSRDADGQCPACQETLGCGVSAITEIQLRSARQMDEVRGTMDGVCPGCATRYADAVFAALVLKLFAELPGQEFASTFFYNSVLPMLHMMNATSDVLTIKAYRDVCARMGWGA